MRRTYTTYLTISACLLPQIPALASEPPNDLEEVIVSAQKQQERLQDVPVPLTAISANALVESSQLRIQDYYDTVPGLGLAVSGNGGEPVVVIRGITTGGDTNPTVGIVVDEISYGSSVNTGQATPAAVDIDPGDLARVEVLRGPQGTLYGASSMGGLLKFVTVDPSTERFSGRMQLSTVSMSRSDDLGYTGRASINLPVTDSLAVRISGFSLRDPGYIDNAETGEKDVNYRDSRGGRVSALWSPSETFSVKLSALAQKTERNGTDDVDTLLGSALAQRFLTGSGLYERETRAYSATMTADLGDVQLVSATGYSEDKLVDTVDLTTYEGGLLPFFGEAAFGVDRALTVQRNDVDKFTQELRASIPMGERVNWLVGAFYTKEDTFRDNDNRAADDNGATYGSILRTTYDPSTFEEYAAFSTVTVQLTKRWDVQVGGRYSENEQGYPINRSGPIAALVFGADPSITPEIKSEDSAFTYLVTPRFKVSPDLMVYARLASGYRPGGPNFACGLAGVPCKFEADTTENYDVGVKGTFAAGRFTYDASLYYIDWKDIQIAGIRLGGFSEFTGNVSGARSRGAELTLSGNPIEGLKFSAWTAYNDAELTEAFPEGQLFGRAGDRLPYGSRVSGSISLDQEFPVGSFATGGVGGSVSYVGERKGNFQRAAVRETYPSYVQVDLRAGLTLDAWSFDVFANNVTDKRGVLRGGLDAVFVPSYFTYIQPRTMGLSIMRSF